MNHDINLKVKTSTGAAVHYGFHVQADDEQEAHATLKGHLEDMAKQLGGTSAPAKTKAGASKPAAKKVAAKKTK